MTSPAAWSAAPTTSSRCSRATPRNSSSAPPGARAATRITWPSSSSSSSSRSGSSCSCAPCARSSGGPGGAGVGQWCGGRRSAADGRADRAADGRPEAPAAASRAAADRSAAADRRGAGEMAVTLTDADRARLADAIRAAEAGTSGEIYVVVAQQADSFRLVPVLWAALAALLVPWPLYLLTYWPIGTILLAQVLAFVVIALAGSHPA